MSENVSGGMKEVRRKSALAFYGAAAVWLIWAIFFPLHSLLQILLCAAISAVLFFVLDANASVKVEYVERKVEEYRTGNDQADALLAEGYAKLSELRTAASQVEDEEVRAKTAKIIGTCDQILDAVQQKPQNAPKLQQFLGYYLPTLVKLIQSYAQLEDQTYAGENISATMERIEGMLDTIDQAFLRQLDALFADTAVDITADISVMQQLMASEGLTQTPTSEIQLEL